MPIHIPVQNNSVEQAITVRGGHWDDDIFDQDWCNHAGAEVEELTSDAGLDTEQTENILVCDKCGAQYIGEEWITA